ncbi:MAG TPA: translesion error-prone DNA polymerase V autoproteolytic subunit [Candidatus Babeliales bacterium]|nr:translesion error-prone DNA polymerase V autoproteolytic subunit [Candidatus Babeliales bacterium]
MAKQKTTPIKITTIAPIDPKVGPAIPFLESLISAGFPSSAENFLEKALDLNELLIDHPAATYFIRVIGDSMINAGINSGDILIVDRSLSVANNKIVIARLNDEFLVKRIKVCENSIMLLPENNRYKPITVTQDMDFEVWGIVTCVIHQV